MIKEIKEKKSVLHNRYVKATIMTIFPLLIGGVTSSMGSWNASEDRWFYWKLGALAFLSIIEIIALKKYTDWDKESHENTTILQASYDKLKHENDGLGTSNDAYSVAFSELSNMFKTTAEQLNNITHQVQNEGIVDLSKWNFKKGCQDICNISIAILRKIAFCGAGDGFTINYIQKEWDGTKYVLEMPAYSGRSDLDSPIIQDNQKSIEEVQSYYYARLFQKNQSQVVILPDEESILKNFYFRETASGEGAKYSQYIGIPVVCAKNQMIGLFQVVSHKGNKIADSKDKLQDIARKYFVPLAICAMLMNKIEKAIRAIPTKKEGEQ